jgi:hypothetical protein
MWVKELLLGNPRRVKDQLGMDKAVFRQFIWRLHTITDVTHTCHVNLDKQVAIFLYTIVTNLSNRKVAECFQWSSDTISKYAPISPRTFLPEPSSVNQMLQLNLDCYHITSIL